LNRLLSGIFVAAVWLCGVPALAAGAATGMDSAIKIHNGVNVVKDGKTTYLVTVKDGKRDPANERSHVHAGQADQSHDREKDDVEGRRRRLWLLLPVLLLV
jgi:uncharacterized membrane-anchored protein